MFILLGSTLMQQRAQILLFTPLVLAGAKYVIADRTTDCNHVVIQFLSKQHDEAV